MLKLSSAALGIAIFLALVADSSGRSRHHPQSQPQNKSSPLSTQQPSNEPTPPPKLPTAEQIEKSIADGINTAAQQYEARHPTSPPDNSGWWFNLLLVGFTGGLMVVGAGQGFLTFWTLKATQTVAEAAKESADAVVSQLRAYMHVSLMGPPTIDDERVLKATVHVKNTGQTPAYDAVIVSNIGIISWPPPRPLETIFIDTEATTVVRISLPGGEVSANIPELPNVSVPEEAGLRAGAYRIIVWGRVNYTDTFKNHRTTRYALSIRWEGDRFGLPFIESVGNSSD
jgi:hypothetical protein